MANMVIAKVELSDELLEKFDTVKKRFGVKSNAEVLRFLINEEALRISKETLQVAHAAIREGKSFARKGREALKKGGGDE